MEKEKSNEVLDLSDRDLTDHDLAEILQAKLGLNELYLTCNPKLTSLAPVSKLSNLEVLFIGETQIVDLTPLEKLEKIKCFNADETKITDISPLIKSRQLQELVLTSTKVDNRVLDLLIHFPGLTKLSLSDTNVSGDVSKIKACSNLTSLSLTNIDINDKSLLELISLKYLMFINVDPECEWAKKELTLNLPGLQKRAEDSALGSILSDIEKTLSSLKFDNIDKSQRANLYGLN